MHTELCFSQSEGNETHGMLSSSVSSFAAGNCTEIASRHLSHCGNSHVLADIPVYTVAFDIYTTAHLYRSKANLLDHIRPKSTGICASSDSRNPNH